MPEKTTDNGNGNKTSTPDRADHKADHKEVRARDPKTDYDKQVADTNDDANTPQENQRDLKERQQHKDHTGTHDRDSDFNQQGSYQGEYRNQDKTSQNAKHPDDDDTGYPEGEYEGGDQGSKGSRKGIDDKNNGQRKNE